VLACRGKKVDGSERKAFCRPFGAMSTEACAAKVFAKGELTLSPQNALAKMGRTQRQPQKTKTP
jgi:hypothetical protein